MRSRYSLVCVAIARHFAFLIAAFRVHFRLHFSYDTLNVAVYVIGIELDVLHVIRCFVFWPDIFLSFIQSSHNCDFRLILILLTRY